MNNATRFLDAVKTIINKSPNGKRALIFSVIVAVICLFLIFYLIIKLSFVASLIITIFVWAILNIGSVFLFFWLDSKRPNFLPPIVEQIEKDAEISQDGYLIHHITDAIFTNNPLPHSLKQIKIQSYKTIYYIEITSIPIDTPWIFLTGENGFGKTSILRAIVIGFIGRKDEEETLIDDYDTKIGVELYHNGISTIKHLWDNSSTNNTTIPFACYGPSRLQIQNEQTKNDVAKKSTTTYSLFNADGVLLNIEYSLTIWYLKEDPKFKSVIAVFKKLIPYLEDIQITDNEEVFYIEKEPIENGIKYNPVTFNELASGFRSILAMIGDMMIRLFKSQPDVTEPSELAGIVIIDEIDLHWHPKMQREIPSLLSSIFPKIQFIASTHSLVPLLGAPENSVLLKVNRTVEEGITVEKMDIDFQALSSDVMLRDIFDLEKYQSDAKQKAWERYTKLKGLIHFEKDEAKKKEYIHEREVLGDKYNFTL
jgi:AAA15 family ATPase/GTPase